MGDNVWHSTRTNTAFAQKYIGLPVNAYTRTIALQGGPKMSPFLYALTLPNINRFSKLRAVMARAVRLRL